MSLLPFKKFQKRQSKRLFVFTGILAVRVRSFKIEILNFGSLIKSLVPVLFLCLVISVSQIANAIFVIFGDSFIKRYPFSLHAQKTVITRLEMDCVLIIKNEIFFCVSSENRIISLLSSI